MNSFTVQYGTLLSYFAATSLSSFQSTESGKEVFPVNILVLKSKNQALQEIPLCYRFQEKDYRISLLSQREDVLLSGSQISIIIRAII